MMMPYHPEFPLTDAPDTVAVLIDGSALVAHVARDYVEPVTRQPGWRLPGLRGEWARCSVCFPHHYPVGAWYRCDKGR